MEFMTNFPILAVIALFLGAFVTSLVGRRNEIVRHGVVLISMTAALVLTLCLIKPILIDGEKMFVHTPWRCDCATFREMNPVSGNFWNGQSSSDLSRSGWCPGTATQPVYFDLSFLKPGKHTITIAIPQGDDEGNSFNHWMVSGMLIGVRN